MQKADEILGGLLTDPSKEKIEKAAVMLENKEEEVLEKITDEQRASMITGVIGEGKVKAALEKGVKLPPGVPEEKGENLPDEIKKKAIKISKKKKKPIKETTSVGNLGVNMAGAKSVEVTPGAKPKKAKVKNSKTKEKRTISTFGRKDKATPEGQGEESPWSLETNPYANLKKWGESKSILDSFISSVLTESSRGVKTATKKVISGKELTPRNKAVLKKTLKREKKLNKLANKAGSESVGRVYD